MYTLTAQAVQRLQRDHLRLSYQIRDLTVQIQNRNRSAPAMQPIMFAGKTKTAISAMAANVPGTGTATIYYRDTATTNLTQRVAAGGDYDVYNLGDAIEAAEFCLFARDGYGDWWVIVVPC